MNERVAVDYLLGNYPEWRKIYNLYENHWAAMTIVARDLSNACGLFVYADRIWTGDGCIGLGIAFMGTYMKPDIRSPQVDEMKKKLEQKLVELKLVVTPELEILCSSSYGPHLKEPFHMQLLPPPEHFESVQQIKYWKNGHECRRLSGRKVEEERREVEKERLKVRKERQGVERVRRKVERERRKVERERWKVERERREVEKERRKVERETEGGKREWEGRRRNAVSVIRFVLDLPWSSYR